MITVQEAYRVLGVLPGTEKKEIKKKYRKLMMQVHPDVATSFRENYGYSAQEINSAYAVLMKEELSDLENNSNEGKRHASKKKKNTVWNAPVNVNAFAEREVLQYVEDYDGTVLGNYCVVKGKYLWKTDEEFPLFLLSLYRCSKELLDGIDEKLQREETTPERQRIQAELTYLLAQQFIDGSAILAEFVKKEEITSDGDQVFHFPAMLELTDGAMPAKVGEMIYPSGIRNHKLYLKDRAGRKLGYLSFLDDRLYYIVIPLFEQKRVQVKIQAAETRTEKRRNTAARYQKLNLWIKLLKVNTSRMPENLNLQIEELLKKYKEILYTEYK
ncbi:MAG: J domain-containing protein, partial [Lachnospiraceae bacterium]|nr:J domain-containing protein [Lachnospiraceae bacterium]